MRKGHFGSWRLPGVVATVVLALGFVVAVAGPTPAVTAAAATSASLGWHPVVVQAPPGGTGKVVYGVPQDLLSTGNVTCLSRSDCVVAGYLEDDDADPNTYRSVAWRWDGKAWMAQSTGVAGDAGLVDTACPTAHDCWAVGARFEGKAASSVGLVDHYNGKTWSPSPLPGAAGVALNGISCPSVSDCVAVGNLQTSTDAAHAVAYRWNGTAWSVSAAPSPTGAMWTVLESIDCVTAQDCIVVGDAENSLSGSGYFFGERFNGASWSLLHLPNPAEFNLGNATSLNLSCPSDGRCVAVGSAWHYTKGQQGLNSLFGVSYVWDGKAWESRAWDADTCFGLCPGTASATSPLAWERFYYPDGESCVTPTDCWVGVSLDSIVAEGYRGQGPLDDDIVLAHWDGTTFKLSKGPSLGFISAVGCLPDGAGSWCVGLGEAPSAWAGTGTSRQPSKVKMTGGYFVAGR